MVQGIGGTSAMSAAAVVAVAAVVAAVAAAAAAAVGTPHRWRRRLCCCTARRPRWPAAARCTSRHSLSQTSIPNPSLGLSRQLSLLTRCTDYLSHIYRAAGCRAATSYQPGRTSRRSPSRGARLHPRPVFAGNIRCLRRRLAPSLHVQAPGPAGPPLPASPSNGREPHHARAPALLTTCPLPTLPRHRRHSNAAPPPQSPPRLRACASRRRMAPSSPRRAATRSRRGSNRLGLRSSSACPGAPRPPRPSAARAVPLTGSSPRSRWLVSAADSTATTAAAMAASMAATRAAAAIGACCRRRERTARSAGACVASTVWRGATTRSARSARLEAWAAGPGLPPCPVAAALAALLLPLPSVHAPSRRAARRHRRTTPPIGWLPRALCRPSTTRARAWPPLAARASSVWWAAGGLTTRPVALTPPRRRLRPRLRHCGGTLKPLATPDRALVSRRAARRRVVTVKGCSSSRPVWTRGSRARRAASARRRNGLLPSPSPSPSPHPTPPTPHC